MKFGFLLFLLCGALAAQTLPTIVVLATGGTIASRQNLTQGTSLPSLTGNELVSAVPGLLKVAKVRRCERLV